LIRQQSGAVGEFDNALNLRGFGEPMVIVDGVLRTGFSRSSEWLKGNSQSASAILSTLNPDDIESISVLKDASASLYGLGSQNGVILVTTKKGEVGKPSIRYSNTLSFGFPTERPEEVDIITYMNLENEMLRNSHRPIKYTDDFIKHYENGEPGYIDTKWSEEVLKKFSFSQNHNLSFSGGTQQTQYYLSARVNDSRNLINNPELGATMLGFNGNLTTKLNDNLTLQYMTSIDYNKRNNIDFNSNGNLWYYAYVSDRTIAPTVYGNPDHWTTGNNENRNIKALTMGEGGYSKTEIITYNNSLDLKYNAPFLKGLVFDAFVSYQISNIQTNELSRKFPVYDYWSDKKVAENASANQYEEDWSKRSGAYGKFQVNYNNRFGSHNIGAMFAAETRINWVKSIYALRQYGTFFTHDIINQGDEATARNSGSRSDSATAGYLGRINYDYEGKYLVEIMARYDGNYLYAKGHRWGFFPSYSLGWRVSEEPFIKNNLPWLNNFKVRWSDGITGGAQGSPYAYLLGYTATSNYVFAPGSQLMGYANNSVAQTLISWTKARLSDIGFDWEVKRGIFGGSIDWYWRNTTGIAATSTNTVPDMYGLSLPQQNLNASQNVGIDLQLTHRNRIGDFNYSVTGTVSFTRSRQTHIEAEKTAIYTSAQNYFNNHREGRWNNALSGTMWHWQDGSQFTNWEEINNSPVIYSTSQSMTQLLPGMYRIEDRNGDGVINNSDRYYTWGEDNPPLQFGLMFFFNYKGFDLSMTFNGASLSHKNLPIAGVGYGYFGTFFKPYMDHYTLAEGYSDPFDPESVWKAGYWPAIAKATYAGDNFSNATYRVNQPYTYIDGTYFRLKSIELGYNIPNSIVSKVGLKGVRVYFNGTNLITIGNKLFKHFDPERMTSRYMGIGGMPLMKNFSVGVNVNF
jgi:TonB-linked SusC/RagA family outer membrane protein